MLTEEGNMLRRRAEEILSLVHRTEEEISSPEGSIAGTVMIGAGETRLAELFARTAKEIQKKYPDIHYVISSGNAGYVFECLDKGLIDFGLVFTSIDAHKYDSAAVPVQDVWGVLMRKDSPLASRKVISPEDLWDKPLIISHQKGDDTQLLRQWLGRRDSQLNIIATYNLIFNASLLVENGLGYALCYDGIINTEGSGLCFRPFDPPLKARGYIVWKKYQVFSKAAGNAIIQLDESGRNCIIIYAGGNKEITRKMVDSVLADFSGGDWLVLQNEINEIDYLIRCAADRGMRICFNPAPYEDAVRALPLNLVDVITVNEIEGAMLASLPLKSSYEEILEKLVRDYPDSQIILTAGRSGAFYGYKDIREKGDIIDIPVKDTTAAGDTFIGYYLASVEKGFDVKEALMYACKASSIAVSREGAMQSIPEKEEVFD